MHRTCIMLLMGLLIVAATATAEPPGRDGPPGRRRLAARRQAVGPKIDPGVMRLWTALDLNKDGKIDKAEFAKAAPRILGRLRGASGGKRRQMQRQMAMRQQVGPSAHRWRKERGRRMQHGRFGQMDQRRPWATKRRGFRGRRGEFSRRQRRANCRPMFRGQSDGFRCPMQRGGQRRSGQRWGGMQRSDSHGQRGRMMMMMRRRMLAHRGGFRGREADQDRGHHGMRSQKQRRFDGRRQDRRVERRGRVDKPRQRGFSPEQREEIRGMLKGLVESLLNRIEARRRDGRKPAGVKPRPHRKPQPRKPEVRQPSMHRPERGPDRRGGRAMARVFRFVRTKDKNQDKKLDLKEFGGDAKKFKALDVDKDGFVTVRELLRGHGGRRERD